MPAFLISTPTLPFPLTHSPPKQTWYPCSLAGKLKLCVWQRKAGTKWRRGRSKCWWLLLRGQQEGNGDYLRFHPWNTTSMFLQFYYITRTHMQTPRAWVKNNRTLTAIAFAPKTPIYVKGATKWGSLNGRETHPNLPTHTCVGMRQKCVCQGKFGPIASVFLTTPLCDICFWNHTN